MKKLLNQMTGNPSVDLLAKYPVQGDCIPPKAYKYIKRASGKTDMLAVAIYSNIIYWHRPTPVYDSQGNLVNYKKKFHGDMLHKRYDEYAELFDVTKRQVKEAFDVLCDLGFINRIFKNIRLSDGNMLYNVMYIELVADKLPLILDEVSFVENLVNNIAGEDSSKGTDEISSLDNNDATLYDDNTQYGIQFYVTPPTKKRTTYTNTKTNNFTNNTTSFNHSNNSSFDGMNDESVYREILSENIDLDRLLADNPSSVDEYTEYFEIMVDLVCHNKAPVKSHGHIYPAETVKSRILKLKREHLEHVHYVYQNYIGQITDFYKHCAATLYNSYFEANNCTICDGNTKLFNLYSA